MRLLIATTNAGKLKEFRQMLGEKYSCSDLTDCAPASKVLIDFSGGVAPTFEKPVEETGRTFRANACLKASEYARRHGAWTLADDSGLAVDALAGAPGVHSARWAEMHESGRGDNDNNALLLKQLARVPDERRTARFVCVLALADPRGRILLTAEESVEGRVLNEPRGSNGFGYDPLFFVPSLGKTTAELPSGEKHAISHRGKALRRIREMMDRMSLDRVLDGRLGD